MRLITLVCLRDRMKCAVFYKDFGALSYHLHPSLGVGAAGVGAGLGAHWPPAGRPGGAVSSVQATGDR